MRRVLQRANDEIGTSWTLHDLRHTAAQRMISDPRLSLTDVQCVLGHVYLTTTQIYLQPRQDEMIARVLEHQHRRAEQAAIPSPPLAGYRAEVLQTLLVSTLLPTSNSVGIDVYADAVPGPGNEYVVTV